MLPPLCWQCRSVQIPGPSAEGLFKIPQRPRNRGYRLLNQTHSLVSHIYNFGPLTFDSIATASYQFAFILDPVGEQASRWTPLISVGRFFLSRYLINKYMDN